MDQTIN